MNIIQLKFKYFSFLITFIKSNSIVIHLQENEIEK